MKTTIVSKSSNNLIRRMMLIVALLFIAATISSQAEAVILHGIAIAKGCDPVRVCDTNADCNDNNVCTTDVCDTTFSNTTHCEVTVSYNDQAGDNILISNVTDTLGCLPFSNTVCVVTVNPEIESVSGNTTCVPGAFVPCTIGPAIASLPSGSVLFHVAGYNPTAADLPGPIVDNAAVIALDQCDSGIDTAACQAAPNRFAQTQSATTLVNGCTNTPQPSTPCPDTDGNVCTTAGCNAAGTCDQNHVFNPSITCPDTDNNPCTTAGCNDAGVCDQAHVTNPSTTCPDTDNNPCTTAGCNAAGVCDQNHVFNPSTTCPDTDNNPCTTAGCNASGVCDQNHVFNPSTTCPDTDGNACTQAGCNASGVCDQNHILVPCNLTCRTPGYWGTHACPAEGCEEQGGSCAQNVTQAVIDYCGGCLEVCGQAITNTLLDDASSAVEGICVSPASNITLQLARQLTAMSLNCCQSGLGADCSGNTDLAKLFSDCNNLCQGIPDNTLTASACRDIIDCFNNGGGGTDSTVCGTLPACTEGTAFDVLGLSSNCNSTGSSNECNAASLISNSSKPCPDCNYCAVIPLPSDVACGPKTKSNPAIGQGQECCSVDSHPTSCPAIL